MKLMDLLLHVLRRCRLKVFTITPRPRARGRPKTSWMNTVTSWTELSVGAPTEAADGIEERRKTVDDAANPHPPQTALPLRTLIYWTGLVQLNGFHVLVSF